MGWKPDQTIGPRAAAALMADLGFRIVARGGTAEDVHGHHKTHSKGPGTPFGTWSLRVNTEEPEVIAMLNAWGEGETKPLEERIRETHPDLQGADLISVNVVRIGWVREDEERIPVFAAFDATFESDFCAHCQTRVPRALAHECPKIVLYTSHDEMANDDHPFAHQRKVVLDSDKRTRLDAILARHRK
jgi:hypothetical protein